MSKRFLLTMIAVTAIVAVTAVVDAPRRSVLSQDGPTSTPTPKPPPPPTPTPKPPPPPTPTSKLPPMPTPDSTSSPTPTSVPTDVPQPQPPSPSSVPEPPGGRIELRVTGLNVYYHWQGSWTVVQWQATEGDWLDVEGWRGTLDEITNGEGKKTWWVAEEGFGRGPFRWVVYSQSEGDRRLGVSKSFYLPRSAGEAVVVEISLQ